jgi:hypothetical protein
MKLRARTRGSIDTQRIAGVCSECRISVTICPQVNSTRLASWQHPPAARIRQGNMLIIREAGSATTESVLENVYGPCSQQSDGCKGDERLNHHEYFSPLRQDRRVGR